MEDVKERRFIKTTAKEIGEEEDEYSPTDWWLDLKRPIKDPPGFIAVQTHKGNDPNDFVKCDQMFILYNDQAEYYFVCSSCYNKYKSLQWAGSTKASTGWRERSIKNLEKHHQQKGWCQFCDPIFGNGGWTID